MNTLFRCTPLLLLIASLTGCAATTASLDVWEANDLPLAGRRETAVLNFEGNSEVAAAARGAVVAGIQKTGFHNLSSPQRVAQIATRGGQPDAGAAPLSVREVIQQAKQAGVDAVIAARVDTKSEGSLAAVMLRYQVIETGTGKITHQDKIVRRDENVSSTDADAALKKLAVECAEVMVTKISAHVRTEEVKLATMMYGAGSAEVAAGNTYATKGDWDNAARQYKAALDKDEQNHVAMYNLGLAHQSKHDYKTAANFFANARKISDQQLYKDAEASLNHASQTYDLVQTRLAKPALQPTIPVGPGAAGPQQEQIAAGNRTQQQPAYQQQPYNAASGQNGNVQQVAGQQQLPPNYQQFPNQNAPQYPQQQPPAAGGYNNQYAAQQAPYTPPANGYDQQPQTGSNPPNEYVQRRYTEPLNARGYENPSEGYQPPTQPPAGQHFAKQPANGYASGYSTPHTGSAQAYTDAAVQQHYNIAPQNPGNQPGGHDAAHQMAGGAAGGFKRPAYQRPGMPVATHESAEGYKQQHATYPADQYQQAGNTASAPQQPAYGNQDYKQGYGNPSYGGNGYGGGYDQGERVTRFPSTGSQPY